MTVLAATSRTATSRTAMTRVAMTRAPHPSGLAALVASTLLAFGVLLATAGPTVACSCAMAGPMSDYATVEHAVFAGTAGVQAGRGVPVEVDEWLWGQGAAEVVWLSANSFGDSAGCGVNPPAQGSKWIWVTWLPGNNGDFGTGLCSPAGDLSTPEGQEMLADARSAFAAVDPPRSPPESSPVPPAAPEAPEIVGRSTESNLILVGGGVVLASLALFGGLALVARRQDRARP